ncbi:MAG: hypothetical protein HC934_05635 [Acaryochloridaceae cyanobacterium SU_2_1]|nr:hypothetical protein [Acaryochloridaceae cyanobacterium SU_2_1]
MPKWVEPEAAESTVQKQRSLPQLTQLEGVAPPSALSSKQPRAVFLSPIAKPIPSPWIRPIPSQPREEGGERLLTPMPEQAKLLKLERRSPLPQQKVQLANAQLETLMVDQQPYAQIIGQLINHSSGQVYNLRVYYRILQGLQIVESGHFSVDLEHSLGPGEQVRFIYPIRMAGDLEIPFIEWKYEDGTQGIAERSLW